MRKGIAVVLLGLACACSPSTGSGGGAGGGTGAAGGGAAGGSGGGTATPFDAGAQILGLVTGFTTVSTTGPGRNVSCTPSACYFASTLGSVPRLLSTASALDGLPGSPSDTPWVATRGSDVFLSSPGSGALRYDPADGGYTPLCAASTPYYLAVDSMGNVVITDGASGYARCPAGAAPGTAWTNIAAPTPSFGGLNFLVGDATGSVYGVDDTGVAALAPGAAMWVTTSFTSSFPMAFARRLAGAPNGDLWALGGMGVATGWRYAAFRLPSGTTTWQEVSTGLDSEVKTVQISRYSFALHVDRAGNVLALTHNNAGVHTLSRVSPGATTWSMVLSGNGLPTMTSPVGVPAKTICDSMGIDGPGRVVLVCNSTVYRSTP